MGAAWRERKPLSEARWIWGVSGRRTLTAAANEEAGLIKELLSGCGLQVAITARAAAQDITFWNLFAVRSSLSLRPRGGTVSPTERAISPMTVTGHQNA